MKGYLNSVDANKESFYENDWFRTGDLGYIRSFPDSESIHGSKNVSGSYDWSRYYSPSLVAGPWLVLTGRKKELINRGGEKVSPAEVESIFAEEDYVKQTVCFPMKDAVYGEDIGLAIVTCKLHDADHARALAYKTLARCRRELAAYQVPSSIFVLDSNSALPKTQTGKVQRLLVDQILKKNGINAILHASMLDARVLSNVDYVAPQTPLEQDIVDIWQAVLNLKGVGVMDDLLDLGGTSILAARIAFLIQDKTSKMCSGASVLRNGSIRSLSEMLDESEELSISVMPNPEDFVEGSPKMHALGNPLSGGQTQMLILYSRDTTSPVYNQPLALALYGIVDCNRLHRSVHAMIARHDILRTKYVVRGDAWASVTIPRKDVDIPLPVIDLSETDIDIGSNALDVELAKESSRPFDLFQELPIRMSLFKLRANHVLLLTIHHIATDGWSMNLIQNELASLYSRNEEPKTSISLISYGTYARWQKEFLVSGIYKKQLNYWTNQLAGIEPLMLPSDHPRPPIQVGNMLNTALTVFYGMYILLQRFIYPFFTPGIL